MSLIRSIKDKRLAGSLSLSSLSSKYSFLSIRFLERTNKKMPFVVVAIIVSLVHAAYIISRRGIPVIISALVEDGMSLTVTNLPVVATASFLRLLGDLLNGEGQRWSTWKFKARTMPLSTSGGGTTYFMSCFGIVSRAPTRMWMRTPALR